MPRYRVFEALSLLAFDGYAIECRHESAPVRRCETDDQVGPAERLKFSIRDSVNVVPRDFDYGVHLLSRTSPHRHSGFFEGDDIEPAVWRPINAKATKAVSKLANIYPHIEAPSCTSCDTSHHRESHIVRYRYGKERGSREQSQGECDRKCSRPAGRL